MIVHRGGCHCGRVRFELDAPENLEVSECNCSICRPTAYWHLIVPRAQFRLLSGHDWLTSYKFNTGTAEHLFCRTCGIKSFYVPRSHPEGVSVNARCLDEGTVRSIEVGPFDGVNWERSVEALTPRVEP